jgi:hypothetical protein
MTRTQQGPSRTALATAAAVGVLIGVVLLIVTGDVILGVIAGVSSVAILVRLLRLWYGSGSERRPRHP